MNEAILNAKIEASSKIGLTLNAQINRKIIRRHFVASAFARKKRLLPRRTHETICFRGVFCTGSLDRGIHGWQFLSGILSTLSPFYRLIVKKYKQRNRTVFQ